MEPGMDDAIGSLKRQIANREAELFKQGTNDKLKKKVQKLKKKCEELEMRQMSNLMDMTQRLKLANVEMSRNMRRNVKKFKTLPPYWNAPVHSRLREKLEQMGMTPEDWENSIVFTDALEKYNLPVRSGRPLTLARLHEDQKHLEELAQDPEYARAHGPRIALMRKIFNFYESHPEALSRDRETEEAGEASHDNVAE